MFRPCRIPGYGQWCGSPLKSPSLYSASSLPYSLSLSSSLGWSSSPLAEPNSDSASLATLHCRSLPRKLLQSYQRLLSLLPPFLVSQMRMILVPQLSDYSGKKPALPSAHVCPQTPGYTGRLPQECFHCGPAEPPGPKFHSAVNSFGENHVFLAGIANFYWFLGDLVSSLGLQR